MDLIKQELVKLLEDRINTGIETNLSITEAQKFDYMTDKDNNIFICDYIIRKVSDETLKELYTCYSRLYK